MKEGVKMQAFTTIMNSVMIFNVTAILLAGFYLDHRDWAREHKKQRKNKKNHKK